MYPHLQQQDLLATVHPLCSEVARILAQFVDAAQQTWSSYFAPTFDYQPFSSAAMAARHVMQHLLPNFLAHFVFSMFLAMLLPEVYLEND